MTDSESALEHLKLIRSLMEKATVYRAVSAPTALVGGGLATLLGAFLWVRGEAYSVSMVLWIWLGAFVVLNVFHHGLIWLTAKRGGDPYSSPGLRMAMKAISPPLLLGGVVGICLGFGTGQDLIGATSAWISFYGVALLATSGFSPRSLRVLGFVITVVGMAVWGWHAWHGSLPTGNPQRWSAALMALTFGVFHLIYGTFVRLQQGRVNPDTPTE